MLEEQKAARVAELEPALAERVREVGSLSEAKDGGRRAIGDGCRSAPPGRGGSSRNPRERLEGAEASLAEARREAGDLRSSLATDRGNPEPGAPAGGRRSSPSLTEAKAEMVREFKLMAQQIIEQQSDDFGRQSREQIEHLLNPLADRLTGVRERPAERPTGRAPRARLY